MKNNIFYLFICAFILLLSGCKKFLDVAPKDKIPQAILFSSEQGFKDALIGVYLGMDKPQVTSSTYGLYTQDLSMGLASTLGYNYDNATVSNVGGSVLYNDAVYYNYSDVTFKTEAAAIWNEMYNNIANLNNIIVQIDAQKNIFTRNNYYLVKGEAIGLRALFHFDLLRLFGQPPLTGASSKSIPYVKTFSIHTTPFSTVSDVLDSCIADLKQAKDILSSTDTSAILLGNNDPFISYTQNHMNYWAVQALLARVYLYKGDRSNAGLYAQAVINSNKFPLITSNVAGAFNITRDREFSKEQLFSVYCANVKSDNSALFDVGSSGTPLRLTPAGKTAVYATGSGSTNDYRYISWFDNNGVAVNVPSKFFQDNNLPYEMQNIVPVIRISEMYYIAAENADVNGDVTGGASYLNKVRQARGLNPLNPAGISTDSLSTEIMREYQKEFIQEGQTFFYYKRLNKDLKLASGTIATIPANVYVIPIPDKELQYNH